MGIHLTVTEINKENENETHNRVIIMDEQALEAGIEPEIDENAIQLTDFTIDSVNRLTDHIPGAAFFLTKNSQSVEIIGKFNLYDLGAEAEQSIQLLEWSRLMAHEENCYRQVEINLTDHHNQTYDSISMEKCFVVACDVNYIPDQSLVQYRMCIRNFHDKVKLEDWSLLEDETDENTVEGGAL